MTKFRRMNFEKLIFCKALKWGSSFQNHAQFIIRLTHVRECDHQIAVLLSAQLTRQLLAFVDHVAVLQTALGHERQRVDPITAKKAGKRQLESDDQIHQNLQYDEGE